MTVRYRVLCLTCGDDPFYEGEHLHIARRYWAANRKREGHDVRLQLAEVEWVDVVGDNDDAVLAYAREHTISFEEAATAMQIGWRT